MIPRSYAFFVVSRYRQKNCTSTHRLLPVFYTMTLMCDKMQSAIMKHFQVAINVVYMNYSRTLCQHSQNENTVPQSLRTKVTH